jgi:hypothetical protein
MGCCSPKPNKEDLISQFWTYLPIRQVHIERFANDLIINYKSDHIHRDLAAFKAFFFNSTYLLYGDEHIQETCYKLFNNLAQEHEINLVIFCIAFLCQFDKDIKKNKNAILQISKFLNTHIIREPDRTCDEEYILQFHFKKLYSLFIEMVSYESIEPVLFAYDDREYIDHLRQVYSHSVINRLIEERIDYLGKSVQIRLTVFLSKEVYSIKNDNEVRNRLVALYDLPKSHRREKHFEVIEEEKTEEIILTQEVKDEHKIIEEGESEIVLVEEKKVFIAEEPMIIYEIPEPTKEAKKNAPRPRQESWHDDSAGDFEKFANML